MSAKAWFVLGNYDSCMRDYFSGFLMSVVVWLCWGLFYEFMFRRANTPQKRSVAPVAGLAWLCITGWMIYNLVMWRRFH
jgi:hypothetical protein